MKNNRPLRVCLWLRVSSDSKGQDPALQRADLERVCEQRRWQVVQVYIVQESAFGKTARLQFQAMLEEARKGKFDILVVWSLDRFSREGEWSVSRIMASLQDWNVRFFSYNEPFLDTTGPFAGFLIPLFAWLAHQESLRKGKAVRSRGTRGAGVFWPPMNQVISVADTPYSCWMSPLMKTPAVELYWDNPIRLPRRSAGSLMPASGRT